MNKPWRLITLGTLAVVCANAALLFALSSLAGPTAGLANTNWSLVSINGQPPIPGRALTLQFQSGTQLAGDSGCNSYGTQYHVSGGNIAVTQLISTLRACAEEPLNAQEAVFQQALSHAAQFSLSGSQLTLKDASGGETLIFQKQ